VGYQYYLYLRRHTVDKLSPEQRLLILVSGVVGALLGSRLLAIFENYALFQHTKNQWLFILSNKTILGGLLGGLITIELCKWFANIRASSGDLMTYPIIVGLIIGRIGCAFAGLEDGTYGIPTSLPWGMDLGDGIFRHPTNLYEILFLFVIFIVLQANDARIQRYDGLKFKLFLFSYLVFRFAVEFIKPDPKIVAGLSAIQIAALCGMIYYVIVIYLTLLEREHA
jgi:phosphatidylglycerol:prolipoprotein diacylglycerol transferase